MILNLSLNLNHTLDAILHTVERVVPHDSATLFLVEEEVIANIRSRGFLTDDLDTFEATLTRYRLTGHQIPLLRSIIETQQPLRIPNVQRDPRWQDIALGSSTCAFVGVPLIGDHRTIGVLSLMSNQPDAFTEDHVRVLQTFAAHAALAVKNAQLFLRGQELAALNERHRLARDLHDAVVQTLFSALSIAGTLSRVLETDPHKVRSLLDMLIPMLQGAHSEMRVLLAELRPSGIIRTPLSALFRQLVEALQARKQIRVTMHLEEEPQLTPEIHIALYRIVQESLNNIAKHANAQAVHIDFLHESGYLKVRITDDGRGYEPDPDHTGLGVEMMRERAATIDAVFTIQRRPEGGTEILLIWPNPATTLILDE